MQRCAVLPLLLFVALHASLCAAADELVVNGGKTAKFPGLSLESLPMNGFATLFDSEEVSPASAASAPLPQHPQLALLRTGAENATAQKVAFVSTAAVANRAHAALRKPGAAAAKRKHPALDFLEESSELADEASTIVVDDVADGMDSQLGVRSLKPKSTAAFFQQQQHPLATTSWWSLLRLTISFTLIIKCVAVLSNVVMHISPFPLVKEFKTSGHTGDADSAPFVSIAYCSSQSAFYGMYAYWVTSRSGFLVLCYSNVVGVTLGMYYVYTFLGNCRNVDILALTRMYLKAAAFLVSIQAIAILVLPPTRSLFFVGLTSSMAALISAFSLITSVPEVLRTQCSKNLPVPVLISGAVSAFLWFLCGVDLCDPYIAGPNGIYVLIAGFALSLAAYYPREEAMMPSKAAALFAKGDVLLGGGLEGKHLHADFYGSVGDGCSTGGT
eukprot:TRINITY_DN13080_c0_g1_i1.p1 TRINITY_DN13080_c0_g1~~TRINITY_DN13080_c0_g1_i1.p1  ORF type:complete len:443 (+),score=122.07 TRINITY_DN13080_c0_g1_i1:179-1507(+)